ncbi:conserved hypothetical protein [Gammaproteobacteria bacterium]
MYSDTYEEDFSFSTEVDLIEKSAQQEDDPWLISGIASVEVPDVEEETLIVKGMDTSYLDQHGVINWNHKPGAGMILGEITKSEKFLEENPAKLYIEGELYKDVDESVKAYKLMKALKKSQSNRKMRLSVEGKALVRDKKDPKRVAKSIITNVALTMSPINKETWAVLMKGMCRHPEADSCLKCGYCFSKSASVEKDGNMKMLVKESLDGSKKKCKGGDKEKLLTKADVINLLIKSGRHTRASAEEFVNYLFN